MLRRLLWHWLVLVFGLYVLTLIKPLGISFDTEGDLAWAALILILVNTVVKPFLILISLPLVLVTLGLFLLVINAIILEIIPHLVHGFHVPGFLSACFGAILLSIITGLFNRGDRKVMVSRRRVVTAPAARSRRDDDVIDI
jgi:putative membrane protein